MAKSSVIDKVTTVYVAAEDRVRLQVQLRDGPRGVLWVTQRLCLKLVPLIVDHLDGAVSREVAQGGGKVVNERLSSAMQSFAQDSAVQQQRAQQMGADVVSEKDAEFEQLVETMDVGRKQAGLVLKFPIKPDQLAVLPLSSLQARQWLAILYQLFVKAGWPLDVWPEWVAESVSSQATDVSTAVHLH